MPATAQDKKADKKADKAQVRAQKVLVDNDRMRVTEGTFQPGDANEMMARGHRVSRVVKGSTTMERTHKDGKKDRREVKEGDVYYLAPDHSSNKNVGKGAVTTYVVTLKEPKK